MAIIKRTPRPGELVRGAVAGNLVAFGPDGEPVDSGKEAGDFAEWPTGGNTGDVLKKGADGPEWGASYPAGGNTGDILKKGADGPEWGAQYPVGGSTGNVLTKGADGPEWAAPDTGVKLYRHTCRVRLAQTIAFPGDITYSSVPVDVMLTFINDVSTAYTTAAGLGVALSRICDSDHRLPASFAKFGAVSDGTHQYYASPTVGCAVYITGGSLHTGAQLYLLLSDDPDSPIVSCKDNIDLAFGATAVVVDKVVAVN